jgi:phosphoglycerol transferase
MLLPRENHRVPGLADLAANFRDPSPVPSEAGQSLGLVGAAGLCYLLAVAGLALAGRRAGSDRDRHLSLLALAAVAVGTVGGLSSLIALLVTPEIRSWNRLSIYVGFLALLALAALADRLQVHLRARGQRPLVFAAVLVAVLGAGLSDQTSGADVPRYATLAAQYHSDGAFVAAVEAALPARAMVFQLPVRAFPEVRGPVDMNVSDSFRLYLHSHDLRWSFGGVEGRPTADWQTPLAAQPADALLPRLAAVGFAGLTVDRFGYDDGAAALEGGIRALVGDPAATSPDGRYSFFDLRRLSAGGADAVQQLAALTLEPTQVSWIGVDGLGNDPLDRLGTAGGSFSVAFANPAAAGRPVRFRLSVEGAPASPPLRVTLPDGSRIDVPLSGGRATIDRVLTVPAGRSTATFATDGPPISEIAAIPAERYNLRLSDPAVYDVLPSGPPER